MSRIRQLALTGAVLVGASCAAGEPEATATSMLTDSARLAVDGGEVWYRVTGTGSGMPVILLHGGPGFNSFYLKSLEGLGDDRPVVRYDQLGSGKSDAVTDTTLFTIERYVAELDALRAHLGLEKVHLYGHSWGTMLGVEYYRAHPHRVASLVLASAALEIPAWVAHTRELLKTLPDSMQDAVRRREAEGNYEAADYQAALEAFYDRYVWLRPPAADLDSTMATYSPAVYGYMWGPSEFTAVGTLKDFNATPFLPEIGVPVLYTVGEFDEAGPETIRRHASLTPGAKFVIIPDAAHITTWDNPAANLEAVRTFLAEVDAAR